MDFRGAALLIIDMQRDVLKEIVKSGVEVVPAIQTTLGVCRAKQLPIVHLIRAHRSSGIDVELFRYQHFKDRPLLVEGTEGAEIIDELKPLPSEYVVKKRRFSGFFQTDLLMVLMRLQVTSLIICGVQTPNCIRCTVTDAIAYDYEVTLLEDATAAQTPEVHRANLFDMANMGVQMKTVHSCFNLR